MRSIQIGTDVYAGIWASRENGEETEDAILRRLLGIKAPTEPAKPDQVRPKKIGFSDPRFGISLPEGFEIFRTYKGVTYRAEAKDGKWFRADNAKSYPSLNQLSHSVSGNIENAWRNWYFNDPSGKRQLMAALRK